MFFTNAFFLSSAIADEADLRRRLEGIKAYVTKLGPKFSWVFFIEPELLPADLRGRSRDICLTADFTHAVDFKCMQTTSFLPPERPLSNIEVKFAISEQDVYDAVLLNIHAHNLDTSIAKNIMENRALLTDLDREICCIVSMDGKPVSTATTLLLGECLYVVLVATSQQHRKVCSTTTLCPSHC